MVGTALEKILRNTCLTSFEGFRLGPVSEPNGANSDRDFRNKHHRIGEFDDQLEARDLLIIIVDIKNNHLKGES